MSFTESVAEIVQTNANGLLAKHPSWGRVALREVFAVQNGFPFESKYFNERGDGKPLLRIRDIVSGSTETFYSGPYEDEFIVKPGDIVVGMDGDFNVRAWRGPEALLNQRVCRLVPRGGYLRELLPYVLQGYLDAINASTSAITVKHLSSRTVEEIPLPLPPTGEQGRLLEVLEQEMSRLEAARSSLEGGQRRLKTYRASALKAAVDGRLVPTEAELSRKENRDYESASALLDRNLKERRHRWEAAELARLKKVGKTPKDDKWKAAYVAPAAPDTSKLPQLPDGWCWTSLGQAFNVTVGATPSRGNPAYWGGDIPWVSSGEVAFCRITKTAEKITRLGFENSSTKLNPKGSVLLGMIGEGRTRGQVAILDVDACGNQNAAAIWVSQTQIYPEYVYYYLLGQYEVTRRRGSGNNQPALNKSRVESIPLPLAPLAEQQRIVERLDADMTVISDIEATTEHSRSRISRIRKSILKWAFEGKLVDQDPSDEPAQVLLARIHAERATTTTTTKKQKNGKERLAG